LEHFHQKFKYICDVNLQSKNSLSDLPYAVNVATLRKVLVPGNSDLLFANQLSKLYDSNGDGIVTFEEFANFCDIFANRNKRSFKLQHIFKLFDLNGDGYFTRESLRRVLQSYFIAVMTLESYPVKGDKLALNAEMIEHGKYRPLSTMFSIDPDTCLPIANILTDNDEQSIIEKLKSSFNPDVTSRKFRLGFGTQAAEGLQEVEALLAEKWVDKVWEAFKWPDRVQIDQKWNQMDRMTEVLYPPLIYMVDFMFSL
jgi:hypothetical protein